MAALVAALFIHATDKTPWRAAMLGTRFADKAEIAAGMLLGMAIGNGVSAAGGMLIAPQLTPDARKLFVAVALVSAGLGAVLPLKMPRALPATTRLGAFGTSLVATLVLALGDRTQFVTAALAASSPISWLAPVGAVLGGMVVVIGAVASGEKLLAALPVTVIRTVIGCGLIGFGAALGLAALRLI